MERLLVYVEGDEALERTTCETSAHREKEGGTIFSRKPFARGSLPGVHALLVGPPKLAFYLL